MNKSDKIIMWVIDNGGLDFNFIGRAARAENISTTKFVTLYIMEKYRTNAATAKKVADYFC